MTCAAAVISPMVSFLTRRPVSSAAVMVGDISPAMMRRISVSISSWKISRCSMTRVRASVLVMVMARSSSATVQRLGVFRKLRSIAWPCSLRMDSGWNCTPSSATSRWRTPMISPSPLVAVTTSSGGSVARSIASEW